MSVEVVMPQMGESITEGTVSKWLKAVGEKIEKDEPILEISTDKVDAEVPSPSAGTLLEVRHNEGDTVEVGTVLALIGAEGEVASPSPKSDTPAPTAVTQPVADEVPKPEILSEAVAVAPAHNSASSDDSANFSTEVVMPQMGESITEGTVSKGSRRWRPYRKGRAALEFDDKVDAECRRRPLENLLAINVQEVETVESELYPACRAEGVALPQVHDRRKCFRTASVPAHIKICSSSHAMAPASEAWRKRECHCR